MLRRIMYSLEGRSNKWSGVRKKHLSKESCCAACDADRELEVHHVVPFDIDPARELDASNLITLCRYCHLVIAHLRDFRIYNQNLLLDINVFRMNRQYAYRSLSK